MPGKTHDIKSIVGLKLRVSMSPLRLLHCYSYYLSMNTPSHSLPFLTLLRLLPYSPSKGDQKPANDDLLSTYYGSDTRVEQELNLGRGRSRKQYKVERRAWVDREHLGDPDLLRDWKKRTRPQKDVI